MDNLNQNNDLYHHSFECPGYNAELHLEMWPQFQSSGKNGVPLHCHYSQVHSEPGVLVSVSVSSISQIDLFEGYLTFKEIYLTYG